MSPTDPAFAALLVESYARLVGRPLIDAALGETTDADWLYGAAPFCLLAHDTGADPLFIYANRSAQTCFGYARDELIGLPSRLSAEAPNREQRQQLLEAVTRDGYVAGYSGIRIAKSGRRFRIEDAVIWNLVDPSGMLHGQAAVFRRWSGLSAA